MLKEAELPTIFVSKTIVHRYLRNKTGYVYWCFVDMEQGFYSINREALWYKARKKGISDNMMECVKTMYDRQFCVKWNNEDVTGV